MGQYSSAALTVCFEDTAVLYTISLLFWVSAGLRLLWNGAKSMAIPKLSHSYLSAMNVMKVVSGYVCLGIVCDVVCILCK